MAQRPKTFRRTLMGFAPEDDFSREAMNRIPLGASVAIDWRRPRSLAWHRRYWALVQMIADNTTYTADEIHCLLKLRCGLVKEIREKSTGEVWRVPDSTAFDKMDADQWAAYWGKVADYVAAELLPGMPKNDLARELSDIAGLAA